MKKYLVIILFSIALNFSFQPAASVVFEKHRIAFEISSNVDKATAESARVNATKRIEIRSHLFLELVLAENRYVRPVDTS